MVDTKKLYDNFISKKTKGFIKLRMSKANLNLWNKYTKQALSKKIKNNLFPLL